MPLEEKLSAQEIVRTAPHMSPRPTFYSGRGATLADLDSEALECMYKSVIKSHGDQAGQGFVQMVQDIKVLSATNFLESLYRLEQNEWQYNTRVVSEPHISTDEWKTPGGEAALSAGLADMIHGSCDGPGQTESIRGPFLTKYANSDTDTT